MTYEPSPTPLINFRFCYKLLKFTPKKGYKMFKTLNSNFYLSVKHFREGNTRRRRKRNTLRKHFSLAQKSHS